MTYLGVARSEWTVYCFRMSQRRRLEAELDYGALLNLLLEDVGIYKSTMDACAIVRLLALSSASLENTYFDKFYTICHLKRIQIPYTN